MMELNYFPNYLPFYIPSYIPFCQICFQFLSSRGGTPQRIKGYWAELFPSSPEWSLTEHLVNLFSKLFLPGKGKEGTKGIMTDHLAELFSLPSFHSTSFVRKTISLYWPASLSTNMWDSSKKYFHFIK